ncbi:MAG: hypothetical protein GX369_08340 [Euryarchaeota archaeon]|nr:hypothetical protein [Euryarchaeota archaeon]
MEKALEIIDAIKAARQKTLELVRALSIDVISMKVHVFCMEDLEQIPGDYRVTKLRNSSSSFTCDFEYEATKIFGDVTFYCLLKLEQYEALRKAI